jgi:hypothetical protein
MPSNSNCSWKERTLFVHNQHVETPIKWRNSSVMTNRYRLINGAELYDMEEDGGAARVARKAPLANIPEANVRSLAGKMREIINRQIGKLTASQMPNR